WRLHGRAGHSIAWRRLVPASSLSGDAASHQYSFCMSSRSAEHPQKGAGAKHRAAQAKFVTFRSRACRKAAVRSLYFPRGQCAASVRAAARAPRAAAPPSAASNSRLSMVTVIRPSRARCVKATIPRHERAVPAARAGSAALNVLGTPRDEWALATPTASRGCATAFWLALSIYTRLARCYHKSRCASTTPGTVSKPQRKPKTPWRARCFSGMRWSGCGTGLQHPSNRSCVLFVDARQHRDRAWYIEAIYDPFAANDRALRRVGLRAAMRDRAGSVAAPAARRRKFRRGSFT